MRKKQSSNKNELSKENQATNKIDQDKTPTLDYSKETLTILFWNVENLFDDKNDPGWFDDNMPTTDHTELYNLKIKRLQEILRPFARKKAVMCFSEIENRAVLERLLEDLPNKQDYTIVYHHNTFARVKVAMLSPLKVLHSEALDFARGQRPILKSQLQWHGNELTIFVNHWKSRRGGTNKTEKKRLTAARFLYREFEKIRLKDQAAEVLIIGDFNDEPMDRSLKKEMHASPVQNRVNKHKEQLYNCLADSKKTSHKYAGTITHKGDWHLFDQMLVSSGLLDARGLFVKSCKIHDASGKLIFHNNPNRFGDHDTPDHKRGYSDHLPVIMEIGVKN